MRKSVHNEIPRERAGVRARDYVTWSTRIVVFQLYFDCFYKRFRKVCLECNTVVHAMDCDRSEKGMPTVLYQSAREEVSS